MGTVTAPTLYVTGDLGIGVVPSLPFQLSKSASTYLAEIQNTNSTPGTNYGLELFAGTNSSDAALTIGNYNNTSTLFQILGNGYTGVGVTPGVFFNVLHSSSGSYLSEFQNTNTSPGTSFGLSVQAGTNGSDAAFPVINAADTATFVSDSWKWLCRCRK